MYLPLAVSIVNNEMHFCRICSGSGKVRYMLQISDPHYGWWQFAIIHTCFNCQSLILAYENHFQKR